MRRILMAVLLLAAVLVPAKADQLVVVSNNDTEVRELYPDVNYNSQGRIGAGWYNSGEYQGFVGFDLSAIPIGSTVSACTLRLLDYSNFGNGDYVASRVTGSWDEATLTWNTRPGVTSADEVTLYISSTGYKYWDVTPIAQNWVNDPSQNYGLRIKKTVMSGDNRTFLRTYESGFDTARPRLFVYYTPAAAGPSISGVERDLQYPFSTEPVTVSALVTPPTGGALDVVELQYSLNQGGAWTNVAPFYSNADTFRFMIPAQAVDSVYYRVHATSLPFEGEAYSQVFKYAIPVYHTINQVQFCDTTGGVQTTPDSGLYVHTSAIVTGILNQGRFFIGMPGGGPWSGMFVYRSNQTNTVALGESLEIAGLVTEYHKLTQFSDPLRLEHVGVDRSYDTTELSVAETKLEAYEGVLARVSPVRMVETGGSFVANQTYHVTTPAATDTANVFIYAGSEVVGMAFPVGYQHLVVNCGQYDVAQLNVRYQSDFQFIAPDVTVSQILAPAGTLVQGDVVTPQAVVTNNSTLNAAVNFPATLQIGAVYNQQVTGITLNPGESQTIPFPNWTAVGGTHEVVAFSQFPGDAEESNDTLRGSVTVQVRDIGPTAVLRPALSMQVNTAVAPRVRVRSFGDAAATFDLRMVISQAGTPVYDTTETSGINGGQTIEHDFALAWTPTVVGSYDVAVWTTAAGDLNFTNDTAYSTVSVAAEPVLPWVSVAPMTAGQRQVKAGGWLVEKGDVLYAARGNKSAEFFAYYPGAAADSWQALAPIPGGPDARMPYKGAIGVAGDGDYIYVVKGNNTSEFYRYHVGSNTWEPREDVPLGLSNKRVKSATGGMVYHKGHGGDPDYLYLMKGYKDEFYKYVIDTDSWAVMASPPTGVNNKWPGGSWLAYRRSPGQNRYEVYAHKSKYHDFYRYDILTGGWDRTLVGMPAVGASGRSRKAKDGSCAVLEGDAIYALKGANTQEFWKYTIDGDTGAWAELETIPSVPAGGTKKKKVKAGAGIAYYGGPSGVFYALKGNKTNELWMYTPGTSGYAAAPRQTRDGVMAGGLSPVAPTLSITPNPLVGGYATVRFALPGTGGASLDVYDVGGRRVITRPLGRSASGALSIDLRSLPAGVYLVTLTSAEVTATGKLTVQH